MNATAVRIDTRATRARSMQAQVRRILGHLTRDEILAVPLASSRRALQAFAGLASPVTLHTLEDANPKLHKSAGMLGRPTIGLTILPASASLDWDTCLWSTPGCREACLATSGRGAFQSVQDGREWKTRALAEMSLEFVRVLFAEITSFAERCRKADQPGAWRGNILSDVDWTKACPALIEHVVAELGPEAPYDYTKDASRCADRADDTPALAAYRRNLTFSASEMTPDMYLIDLLTTGRVRRVAIVFAARVRDRASVRPTVWNGFPVVNADEHDYRPADGTGVISGLLAKDVASCSFAAGVESGFFRTY